MTARSCPFCGFSDIGFGGSGEDEPNYMFCQSCLAEGPYAESGHKEALRLWEQRFDDEDPYEDDEAIAGEILRQIRARRGMK